MSWQGYIDTSLVGSGKIDKAALISIAGDSVWATSSGFDLQPEEMKALSVIAKDDKDGITKLFGDGLHVAGERFVLAKAEGGVAYARAAKDDNNPDKGKEGVVICATKQAIIVAHHDHLNSGPSANVVAQGLADHLIKASY